MDKLVRKIEIPLAKRIVEKAGLYIVPEEKLDRLAEIAADAYRDYPLHNWLTNGAYDPEASRVIMLATLTSMKDDALIYADSEELNGFAVWLPLGFTGSKTVPFLAGGGASLVMNGGLRLIKKLLSYEMFAMRLKKKYTGHVDWYLYNLSVGTAAQGRGMASRLMKPMLAFCDEENMQIYLETNKASNVRLYERYGFELKEENAVPGSDVRHYSMVRSPVQTAR